MQAELRTDLQDLYRVISVVGAIGGCIFLAKEVSVKELIKFFVSYAQKNSCGKCVPCRVGTKWMEMLLEKYLKGELSEEEEKFLRMLAEDLGASSRCDLGKVAGKIVKYALEYGLIEEK